MNLVVVGAQWGDEGKGKIVDYLADRADIVVRFSGGANAGHTIVDGDKTYKLHLVPSGIIYPNTTAVLGSGMVIDPESLFNELEGLETQGVSWKGRVLISDRAHLVLPAYKELDLQQEAGRRRPIGTTGRGIGIAYSNKSARDGIRIADLYDEDFYTHLSAEDKEFLAPYKERMANMVIDLVSYMAENKGKKTMLEGAQGSLLDLDLGTYPYVSSGISVSAGACLGGGIGPRDIDHVIGVFKAYSTRVGNGPFPSEFDMKNNADLDETVRELGREYGVTTGRARRCGYLDMVALKYACRVNSLDALVLTHIDVYDTMSEITACVAYEIDGKEITTFPASISELEKAKPILKTFKGWKKDITKAQSMDDLPAEAKDYIKFIEDYTETPIDIVSVCYQRTATITRRDPLSVK